MGGVKGGAGGAMPQVANQPALQWVAMFRGVGGGGLPAQQCQAMFADTGVGCQVPADGFGLGLRRRRPRASGARAGARAHAVQGPVQVHAGGARLAQAAVGFFEPASEASWRRGPMPRRRRPWRRSGGARTCISRMAVTASARPARWVMFFEGQAGLVEDDDLIAVPRRVGQRAGTVLPQWRNAGLYRAVSARAGNRRFWVPGFGAGRRLAGVDGHLPESPACSGGSPMPHLPFPP